MASQHHFSMQVFATPSQSAGRKKGLAALTQFRTINYRLQAPGLLCLPLVVGGHEKNGQAAIKKKRSRKSFRNKIMEQEEHPLRG
jgi:hypothetical protein